jgi:hypothetical protein
VGSVSVHPPPSLFFLEATRKKVEELYEHKYRPEETLDYTPENVDKALEAYKYGIDNHVTPIEAAEKVGFTLPEERPGLIERLRRWLRRLVRRAEVIPPPARMENFMEELGLWRYGRGYLHREVLLKLYGEYRNKKPFDFEVTVTTLLPEHLLGNVTYEEVCRRLYETVQMLCAEDAPAVLFAELKHIAIEYRDWDYTYCCTQENEVEASWWKLGSLLASWRGRVKLANYIIKGVKLCPEVEDYEIYEMEAT